jgi:hypothetical protein
MLNRRFSSRGKYALAAAVASVLLPASSKGDTFYYQHPGSGDFNSGCDVYFSWYNATSN